MFEDALLTITNVVGVGANPLAREASGYSPPVTLGLTQQHSKLQLYYNITLVYNVH